MADSSQEVCVQWDHLKKKPFARTSHGNYFSTSVAVNLMLKAREAASR
jgi:hypothetical protein